MVLWSLQLNPGSVLWNLSNSTVYKMHISECLVHVPDFVRVTGLNSWETTDLGWIKGSFQMTRPVIHVKAVLETWQRTEQREQKARSSAYSSVQKDRLVTQDLPLHLASFHPLLLRSDIEERRTRQCCHCYLGDLCWCFGQWQIKEWDLNLIRYNSGVRRGIALVRSLLHSRGSQTV